ncbi:MAG: HD domain-containing protein [Acidiferrobacterales bacterium]
MIVANARSAEDFIDSLFDVFARCSSHRYVVGDVTMVAHMLQTAVLAEQAGAPNYLIAAALLHDIGHFGTDFATDDIGSRHAEMRKQQIDRRHEQAGAQLLTTFFGPRVTEPIRLHVAAKRYLCAVEPAYLDKLAPTSKHTLKLQGGVMAAAEIGEFETSPHASDAVRLRRWDDSAIVPGLRTTPCEHYWGLLEGLSADPP